MDKENNQSINPPNEITCVLSHGHPPIHYSINSGLALGSSAYSSGCQRYWNPGV